MSEEFARALFPGTVRVLGRTLPPLSLWTLATLQALPSPFVAARPETVVTFADLQLAVRIARTKPLQTPNLKPDLRAIVQQLTFGKSQRYFNIQAGLFARWLEVHQAGPLLWDREDRDPRRLTAPLVLSQATALMRLGMPHGEAWAMSPGYATWLILAAAERESDGIRFTREDDDVMVPELPDDEAQLIEIARKELHPAIFEGWLKARQANQPSDKTV